MKASNGDAEVDKDPAKAPAEGADVAASVEKGEPFEGSTVEPLTRLARSWACAAKREATDLNNDRDDTPNMVFGC